MNSLLLDALQGKNKARPPVWLMRQAGRYMPSYQALRAKHSFLSMCHEPELIDVITRLPVDELGVDAAILFSDILLVPEALGFCVRFEEGGPLIDNPLHPADLQRLSPSSLEEKLSFLPMAIRELKKSLAVPLIGFAGAPYCLVSYVIEGKVSRDQKLTKMWAYKDPSSFMQAIHLFEKAVIEALVLQIQSGCDALQLFDTWAHHLTETQFELFCLAPLKRIQGAIAPFGKPLIYFCKGSSYRAALIAKTGVSAISLDSLCPIQKVRSSLPTIPLQGNLDPEALYMPQAALKDEIKKILSAMHRDPAYIFNLGHGILPDVPYENVKMLVETVHT